MKEIIDNKLFDIAYGLFSRVKGEDFEYVYRGYFTHNITKKILFLADTNIQKVTDRSTIQKRIYYIMVEGLQNITRHQDEVKNKTDKYPGIFAIQKNGEQYYITTGNLVYNYKIPPLKEKIEKINSLEQSELKKFHREILASGSISDKGGAGLGLIEMSRKSGNKLFYSFEKIDEEYSYFYLQTLIPSSKPKENVQHKTDPEQHNSLSSIKKMHTDLNKENILLYFNGFFNQENLLSLLAIIKGRMNMPITTIKVSNIMVEMLQNIIKHGIHQKEQIEGVPGVFFLGQKDDDIFLTSGNYISNNHEKILKKKLDFINNMSVEELSDYYDKILLDFELGNSKKTGLGFSDIRIKSERKLKFDFQKTNTDNNFYLLQTAVTIKK